MQLDKELLNELQTALSQFSCIEKVILFGSRARGDADERSDIDIAILCPNANERDWFAITDALDNLHTLLEVQPARYNQASGEFRQRIEQEGIVIYESRKS